jgi:tetratricopeptide (TPR) repeat protein
MKSIFLGILLLMLSSSAFPCDTWDIHWVNGLEFVELEKFSEAENEFTKCIKLIENEKSEHHTFVYLERAKLYIHQQLWYKALEDLNIVLDCPVLMKKDRIDALQLRIQTFSMLGNVNKMIEDYTEHASINPYMPKTEFTDKYIILRHCMLMKDTDWEIVEGIWIHMGLCEDREDIQRYGDDIVIIKKKQKCLCACQQQNFILNGPGAPQGEYPGQPKKTSGNNDEQLQKQKEGCKYYCERFFTSLTVILNKYVKKIKNFTATLLALEVFRDKCRDCCENNGGFYDSCIKPMQDFVDNVLDPIANPTTTAGGQCSIEF